MDINVRYKNFSTGINNDTEDNTEANARKKFAKLEKLGAKGIDIIIEAQKNVIKLTAGVSGTEIMVTETSYNADDIYNMMDDAVETLKRALGKEKQKRVDAHKCVKVGKKFAEIRDAQVAQELAEADGQGRE